MVRHVTGSTGKIQTCPVVHERQMRQLRFLDKPRDAAQASGGNRAAHEQQSVAHVSAVGFRHVHKCQVRELQSRKAADGNHHDGVFGPRAAPSARLLQCKSAAPLVQIEQDAIHGQLLQWMMIVLRIIHICCCCCCCCHVVVAFCVLPKERE